MKITIALMSLFLPWCAQAQEFWTLNDVSYLMPLPQKPQGDNGLLQAQTSALGGMILPENILARLPALSTGHSRNQIAPSLRVVAVRLDPCFPLPTPQSCQRQVRLVWQPFEDFPRGGLRTVDAALHTFYVLDDTQFSGLLSDISQWKTQHKVSTDGLPLQVHPAWKTQGVQSAALQDFNSLIVKYVGQKNLSRVTVMVVRGAGDMWAFAGFDVNEGQLQSFRIPRITRNSQAFVNFAVPADHFENGQITPTPQGDDTFNNLMVDSRQTRDNNELMLKEFQAITRIENPKIFTTEQMDCVSCHVAHHAKQWSMLSRPDLPLQDLWTRNSYQNLKHNLENKSTEMLNTQSIRAFGYFGREVAISQRVVNESAEVADAVNAWLKKSK